MYMNVYSNEKLSRIPLSAEQFDVVDFIAFESETSIIYPFAIAFDDVTMEMVDNIVRMCNGHTDDTDTLYEKCECVLGINPELIKE